MNQSSTSFVELIEKILTSSSLEQMQSVHAGITAEVFGVLGVQNSVNSRLSYGGTAPVRVREQIARWKAALA